MLRVCQFLCHLQISGLWEGETCFSEHGLKMSKSRGGAWSRVWCPGQAGGKAQTGMGTWLHCLWDVLAV